MPVPFEIENDIPSVREENDECERNIALKAAGKKRKERTELNPSQSQALKSSDWVPKWWPATMAEFVYMKKIGAGEKVEKSEVPPGEQIMDTKMEYLVKVTPTGAYIRHKARWVALGNLKWIDLLQDYYSPMGSLATLMLLFQLAVTLGLIIFSIDIKQAFVNSKLAKPVYVRLPLAITGGIEVIWRMYNALYGLPEAPKVFFKDLSKFLIDNGYTQHAMDECVFTKRKPSGYIWLHLSVDDFAGFTTSLELKLELIHTLETRFEISIQDDLQSHLGMSLVRHNDGSLTFLMPKLINDMEEEFLKDGWDPVASPMDNHFNDQRQDDSPRIDEGPYRRLLGKLMFVVKCRPDLSLPIARLAKRSHKSTQRDWEALVRVLRFILTTRDEGLTFTPGDKEELKDAMRLIAYADAAFCVYTDQKSHGGYCLKLGSHDTGMFLTRSHSHKINEVSSTESEVSEACEATKEIIYLRDFMAGLELPFDEPTILYGDNASTISLGTNFSGNKKRVKHFLKNVHFLFDNVQRSVIDMRWKAGSVLCSDALSKPLSPRDNEPKRKEILGPQYKTTS